MVSSDRVNRQPCFLEMEDGRYRIDVRHKRQGCVNEFVDGQLDANIGW